MSYAVQALPAGAQTRAAEGISCAVIGMLFFVGQDALMKDLLGAYSLWYLFVVRAVVTAVILTPTILLLGGSHKLLTPFWPLHLVRAFLFVAGFSLFYAAFPFMGLAEVSTIFFSAPLFTALFAVILLGEKVGPHRMIALGVGFLGVIVAFNPIGGEFKWVAILPLLCAICYAASQTLARQIGERESTLTMSLYTIAFGGLLVLPIGWYLDVGLGLSESLPHLRWEWSLPTTSELALILPLGLVGMAGYLFLSRAYQVASASLVAPFDYTYLPAAAVLAYFVWNEVPHQTTLIGMALIVSSGLYYGYRELVKADASDDRSAVAEAAFVPNNPMPTMAPPEEFSDDTPLSETAKGWQ